MLIAPHGARWADERPSRQVQVQAVFYATQDDDKATKTSSRQRAGLGHKQEGSQGRVKRSKAERKEKPGLRRKRRGEQAVRGKKRRGCRASCGARGLGKARQDGASQAGARRAGETQREEVKVVAASARLRALYHMRTSFAGHEDAQAALCTGDCTEKRIWRGCALWQLCFKVFAS